MIIISHLRIWIVMTEYMYDVQEVGGCEVIFHGTVSLSAPVQRGDKIILKNGTAIVLAVTHESYAIPILRVQNETYSRISGT